MRPAYLAQGLCLCRPKGHLKKKRNGATYAAESSMQKMESTKKEQDFLIDHLQRRISYTQKMSGVYDSQLEAQVGEIRAAEETLSLAESEVAGVQQEKKRLLSQWQSTLLAIQFRDDALRALAVEAGEQQAQQQTFTVEAARCERDAKMSKEQTERLQGVLEKLVQDNRNLQSKVEGCAVEVADCETKKDRSNNLLERANTATVALRNDVRAAIEQQKVIDRDLKKLMASFNEFQLQHLARHSDDESVGSASYKAKKDAEAAKQDIIHLLNEAQRLRDQLGQFEMEINKAVSHNIRLEERACILEQSVTDRLDTCARLEAELRRRTVHVERKTKEVDLLNRKYEKMLMARAPNDHSGPLEATIASLIRDIASKEEQSRDMQRQWLVKERELVVLQAANSQASQEVQLLRGQHAILGQRRLNVLRRYDDVLMESKELDKNMEKIRHDMQRFNAILAANDNAKSLLTGAASNLEHQALEELKEVEADMMSLSCQLERVKQEKQAVAAKTLEAEEQVLHWQRKLELERDMHEALNTTVGTEQISALQRTIQRLSLKHAELLHEQESIIVMMERCVDKRENISIKAEGLAARDNIAASRASMEVALGEMERNIKNTKRESKMTELRIVASEEQRTKMTADITEIEDNLLQLHAKCETCKSELNKCQVQKSVALIQTAHEQHMVKTLENLAHGVEGDVSGKDSYSGGGEAELQQNSQQHQTLKKLLSDLDANAPQLSCMIQRTFGRLVAF
eukprot:jgi/Botrbrau1/4979/Bobra.0396s0007.2